MAEAQMVTAPLGDFLAYLLHVLCLLNFAPFFHQIYSSVPRRFSIPSPDFFHGMSILYIAASWFLSLAFFLFRSLFLGSRSAVRFGREIWYRSSFLI